MTEDIKTGRRMSDKLTDYPGEAIREMIMRATSDEQRATLLVQQQLAESLQKTNAALVDMARNLADLQVKFQLHLDRFEQHAHDEMRLINKSLGGWKATAVFGPILLSIVGGLGMYSVNLHLQSLAKEMTVNETQSVAISTLQADLKALQVSIDHHTQLLNEHLFRGNGGLK